MSCPLSAGNPRKHSSLVRSSWHAECVRTVLASHNQQIYEFIARDVRDIADRVGSRHVEALSSSDGVYQFWLR